MVQHIWSRERTICVITARMGNVRSGISDQLFAGNIPALEMKELLTENIA
jgi:hypothetical protein